MSEREVPPEFARYQKQWFWSSMSWLIGFFLLGALGILLPALIASRMFEAEKVHAALAIAATVVSGLQTFLRCDTRADRYHFAYRHLAVAIARFQYGAKASLSSVIDAFEEGERVISTAFAPAALSAPQDADSTATK